MSLHGDHGDAWRRRQLRLRSWWWHEQQTVAAVLATVTHHSHSKVGTANDAPRGQRTVTSRTCRELRTLLGRWQAHNGGAARGTVGALAAGEAAAARRHRVRNRPESRCSCAADGGAVAECPSVLRHASAGDCRAGYWRAQDLTGQDCAALGRLSASAADGGPVGGCADCRVLFFAPSAYCRADRWHSSSGSCTRRRSVEVFKVYSQDRIQQRFTSSKPLTFQFRAGKAFKALAQDRVQQLLHLTLVLQIKLGKGFFALFPEGKVRR